MNEPAPHLKKVHGLFVCTGNTCRSQIAEALGNHIVETPKVKSYLEEKGIELSFSSAGLVVDQDDIIHPHAVLVLKEIGIEVDPRKPARQLTRPILDDPDLNFVIGMTIKHFSFLKKCTDIDRLVILRQFVPGLLCSEVDITDPVGQLTQSYRFCLRTIQEALQFLIPTIGECGGVSPLHYIPRESIPTVNPQTRSRLNDPDAFAISLTLSLEGPKEDKVK